MSRTAISIIPKGHKPCRKVRRRAHQQERRLVRLQIVREAMEVQS